MWVCIDLYAGYHCLISPSPHVSYYSDKGRDIEMCVCHITGAYYSIYGMYMFVVKPYPGCVCVDVYCFKAWLRRIKCFTDTYVQCTCSIFLKFWKMWKCPPPPPLQWLLIANIGGFCEWSWGICNSLFWQVMIISLDLQSESIVVWWHPNHTIWVYCCHTVFNYVYTIPIYTESCKLLLLVVFSLMEYTNWMSDQALLGKDSVREE